MKALKYTMVLFITVMLMYSCGETQEFMDTSYSTNKCVYKGRIWYVVDSIINSMRYYDLSTEKYGSLCSDPLCNHMNKNCILDELQVKNFAITDDIAYVLAYDYRSGSTCFYVYDLEKMSFSIINAIKEEYILDNWCVYDGNIYYQAIDENKKCCIYKYDTDTALLKPQIILEEETYIYDFWIDDKSLYYYNDKYIKNNDKVIQEITWKFNCKIMDGAIYFSKNSFEPSWPNYEDKERVKGAIWPYDLYMRKLNKISSSDILLVENVYDDPLIYKDDIYYLPFDMTVAFSYPMPGAEESKRTIIYDMSTGKINKYNIDNGNIETIIACERFLILDLIGVWNNCIIVRGVDYKGVSTMGEMKETKSNSYYDNIGIYIISENGNTIKKISLD